MAHRSNNPNEKWCVQGQHFTDRSNFNSNRSKSDGLQGSCRACDSARTTALSREYRTGVSPSEYDRMYAEQNGCCAGCGQWFAVLCADHDHGTGKPRGLLCPNCNKALGLVKDSPRILGGLLRYLSR